MASVTSYGAAGEVTGSCHLLESASTGRVLLDCGLHQGGDAVERVKGEEFGFQPTSIDALVLSHAHLDHTGLLPRLCREGFSGPILCTQATFELLDIMLRDSVGLYLRDLEHANLRRARKGQDPQEALFGMEDVDTVLSQCQPAPYREPVDLGPAASLYFHDAGHILGSAIVEISFEDEAGHRRLVFSGDLGKPDSVLMNAPATLPQADLVMLESTYGDRDHRRETDTVEQLREILHDTWVRGGSVMLPSFAVGRTQEILFHLGCLHHRGDLDNWQVFLDSPMAIAITRVYDRWLSILDSEDVRELSEVHRNSLETFLPTLNLAESTDESMAINRIRGGAIIIAGSGMCTGGRIRHHLKQRIWDDRNSLVFAGYQARGTLGRILVDGARFIKLFGEEYIVKAKIETLGGLSAHAGQRELLDWLGAFENRPRTLLVHGEPQAQAALAEKIRERGNPVEIAERGKRVIF